MTSRNTGGAEPLYEYDLATKQLRKLFACNAPCLGDDEPVYSPDGKRVAFIRAFGPLKNEMPSDCGLWIGELADRKIRNVTSNARCDREYLPRWSSDGARFIYWRLREHPVGNVTGTAVFVMDVSGAHERQLTDWNMFAGDGDWSPDGEWIVFGTHPLPAFNFSSEVSNLYRMHPDGSGMEQLTHHDTGDLRATQPRYTPNGRWILFTAVTSSSRELWLMPAAG